MRLVSFKVKGKRYKFKEPLLVERDNQVVCKLCIRYEALNLVAFGDTWSACDTAIRAQLAKIWEDVVLTDEKLTEEGIAYKNKLLAMVEEYHDI